METPPKINPENLRPESAILDHIEILEERKDKLKQELEMISFQIISTEKEMAGNDEFGNPAPNIRNSAYQTVLEKLQEKKIELYGKFEECVAEQVTLRMIDKGRSFSNN